ncbi:MAG: superoxide dismutase family protein [Pseudoflavonifractor sp.]|nr:superoxide dismutase family protein [Pseudoflavonifractor sp.]
MEYPVLLPRPAARALLQGDEAHSGLRGEVLFCPYGRGTLVIARVVGLPSPGFLGFHVHTGGSCTAGGDIPFSSAGGHYDPYDVPHPWHSGDLPPLLASGQGTALLAVYTDRFRPEEVVGRTVVVHERADDFRSQPAGDSGSRLACGVIQAV